MTKRTDGLSKTMSKERPAISIEIRRQVLFESRHRCAVCCEPIPLEYAHIVPWCKTMDHRVSNLIALCANCHSRADKECWGAAFLRKYKRKPCALEAASLPPMSLEQRALVELIIAADPDTMTARQRLRLVSMIAAYADVSLERVKLLKVSPANSSRVLIRLPIEAAHKLIEGMRTADPVLSSFLEDFHPLEARLVPHGNENDNWEADAQAGSEFRAQSELEGAEAVQRKLHPRYFELDTGMFEVAGVVRQLSSVGGDYCEAFRLDENRVGLCIADIAGRGFAAALGLSFLVGLLKQILKSDPSLPHLMRSLSSGLIASGIQATLSYAELDSINLTITYANAGSHPPILMRADGSVRMLASSRGIPLGFDSDSSYQFDIVKLLPGDRLCFCTDGLLELGGEGEHSAEVIIATMLLERASTTAEELAKTIVQRLRELHPSGYIDDLAIMIVEVRQAG